MAFESLKTVECSCSKKNVIEGDDPIAVLLRENCPDCGRPLWDSYFTNMTGTPRAAVYNLAHRVIDMAEKGAPLEEIANALSRYKQLLEGFDDDDIALILVMIPARLSKKQVADRFPLPMADRFGNKATAYSWKEEQSLRSEGYGSLEGS